MGTKNSQSYNNNNYDYNWQQNNYAEFAGVFPANDNNVVEVAYNNPVTLECIVVLPPNHAIKIFQWLKSSNNIDSGHLLFIAHADEEDSGSYRCEVVIKNGEFEYMQDVDIKLVVTSECCSYYSIIP